jgi:hypothetical protein
MVISSNVLSGDYIVLALHSHCTRTALALHSHCTRTALALHSHCTRIVPLILLPNVFFVGVILIDPLPMTIGGLVDLQHVDLRLNNLSGTLPPTIGQCTKLVTLNLSNNHFTGG